jgi:hypothetical protein
MKIDEYLWCSNLRDRSFQKSRRQPVFRTTCFGLRHAFERSLRFLPLLREGSKLSWTDPLKQILPNR